MDRINQSIDSAEWAELGEAHETGVDENLHLLLSELAAQLRETSDSLTQRYFSHSETRVS